MLKPYFTRACAGVIRRELGTPAESSYTMRPRELCTRRVGLRHAIRDVHHNLQLNRDTTPTVLRFAVVQFMQEPNAHAVAAPHVTRMLYY